MSSSDTFSGSDGSSGSDSDESDDDNGFVFEIEGWNQPTSSPLVDTFIADMKVGYECNKIRAKHRFSYPYWSIGLKLQRNDTI